MIVLYSYPELFGVADNNGYGLKVFAFMRLAGLPFTHEHIFDASAAPRGQLPYIADDGAAIGDSETIIAHLTSKYRLTIMPRSISGSATLVTSSPACSTTFIGSCPIHAGRTSATGRPFAMRSCANTRT
jgi:hypothetical protein